MNNGFDDWWKTVPQAKIFTREMVKTVWDAAIKHDTAPRNITVERTQRVFAGSCNACVFSKDGEVTQITIRGLSVRLCDNCLAQLKMLL